MSLRNFSLFVCLALAAAAASPAETRLGAPLKLERPTEIAAILAHPGDYVGEYLQVRGKVTAVCERMGCWMQLADAAGKKLRIKVEDGAIVFPKSAVGKTAVAEGKLEKIELTREQALERARHHAEEQGREFDPSSVEGPVTLYQLRGAGAVILD